MAPRTRRWFNIAGYTLFLALVSIVLLEILMTILDPYLFKGFEEYDPDLGFRVRPYANGTNQFGFNERDYALQKPSGAYRILIVGDSFGWAGGIDGNYTAVLEEMFDDHYGSGRVEVINSGYGGTHTAEQLGMLRKYGLRYNPDLVFLGFFVGNDFADADPNRKRIIINGAQFDIDKRREITFLGYPIVPTSRLYQFVKQKYVVWKEMLRGRSSARKASAPGEQDLGTFSEERFLYIERVRLELFNREKHENGDFDRNVSYILNAIGEMKALLNPMGIEFHVGIYPDEFQVNQILQERLFEEYELRREDYDLYILQRILREHLDSLGIPYIDLTDAFVSGGRTQVLYKLRDTHWNDSGIRLAAEFIFGHLAPIVEASQQGKPRSSLPPQL